MLINDGILPGSNATDWLIVSASSENATITINNSELLYTPNNNFVGSDAITYIVQDQSGGTYPAKAIVTVHQSGADRTQGSAKITVNGVNTAPVISGEIQIEMIDTAITNPFPILVLLMSTIMEMN